MSEENNECVRVVVRARPFSKKEIADGRKMVVSCDAVTVNLKVPDSESEVKGFTFDTVYDENSTQRAVYDETAYPLVESVLKGYNGTIFAYGQTGCGKTHTMQGLPSPPELRGIIPNSFDHIFDHIQVATKTEKVKFLVRCSYLEIYNEEIRDLLSPQKALRPGEDAEKLELHENPDQGVYVKDLTMTTVDSVATIDKVMMTGNKYRTTGATAMNETSSRSHSIFTIVIEMSRTREDGKEHITKGKLNLVDLAGSERASKTGATGARMKEGIKINLSLTALGNVISSLVENAGGGKQRHIPYRDSKLTRLLQDSLGGNTKTVMVAAIGPADYNYEETLSTLRYANRAKNIKNKPKLNEDPKDALLRQYKEEIERLKALLLHHLTAAGTHPDIIATVMASVGGGPSAAASAGVTTAAAAAAAGKKAAPAAPAKPAQPPTPSEPTPAPAASVTAVTAPVAALDSSRSKGGSSSSRSSSVEPQHPSGGKPPSLGERGVSGRGGGVPSVTGNSLAASIAASQPPLTIRGAPSSSTSDSSGSGSGSGSGGGGVATPTPAAIATASDAAGAAAAPASAALREAERELEKERSGREDMMKKMLALQDLVLGSGKGVGGGGGKGGGAPRSRTNSAGSGVGVASVGEFDDPELRAAREREETRRARAAELRRSRENIMAKRLAATSAAADSSGGEWDEEEDEDGDGDEEGGGRGRLLLPSAVKGGGMVGGGGGKKFRGGFTGTVCAVCRGKGDGGGGGNFHQTSSFLPMMGANGSSSSTPGAPSAYLQYPVGGRPRGPSTPPKQVPLPGAPQPPPPPAATEQQQQLPPPPTEVPMSVEALPPPQPQKQQQVMDRAEEKQREEDEADEKVRWEGRESKEGDDAAGEGYPPGSPLPPFSPPPSAPALPPPAPPPSLDMTQYVSREEMRGEMLRLQARVKRKYERRYGGELEALKGEIAEEREEWGNERERTSGELREVNKLASLLEAVVGLFLPEREKDKALDRAVWDETRERWLLPRVKPRPGYAVRSKVGSIAGIGPQGVGLKMAVRNPVTGMMGGGGGGGGRGVGGASSYSSGTPSDPEDGGGSMVGGSSYNYSSGEGGQQDHHQQQQQQQQYYQGYEEEGEEGDGEEGGGMVLAPGEELVVEDIAHLRASTITALPTLPTAGAGGHTGRQDPSSNLMGLQANTALPSLHKGGNVKGGGVQQQQQQQQQNPSAFPALPSLAPPSSSSSSGALGSGRGQQQSAAAAANTSFPSLLPASTPGGGRGGSSSSTSAGAGAGAGMFPSLQGGGKGAPSASSSRGVSGGAPTNAGLPSLFPPLGGVDKQVDKALEGWLGGGGGQQQQGGGGLKGSSRGGAPPSSNAFPKL